MPQPCRLCQRANLPLRNSHILPEFLYKGLYDPKHRFLAIDTGEETARPKQKGYREHLLCKRCEGTLSRWETYAAKVIEKLPPVATAPIHEISGVDYAPFRLFQLSLFWRASIATIPMFATFSLGPHQEPIRDLLLHEDPGDPTQYPTLIMLPPINSPFLRLIIDPMMVKLGGHRVSYWPVLGLIWTLVTSSHVSRDSHGLPLHRPGMPLPVINAGVGGLHLTEWFREMLVELARRIEGR